MKLPNERRRLILGLGPWLLLAACQSTPPASAPAPTREQKVATLQQLGFVPADSAWELNLGVKLLFETDIDELSTEGREAVASVARALTRVGIDRVLVEGHTDNVGSARYNEQLSLRRAETVAQRLVKVGLQDSMIERRGLGFSKPVADNATAEGRAQNRRVVVTVRVD